MVLRVGVGSYWTGRRDRRSGNGEETRVGAEREARELLRDRYDAEVKAVAEFFGYAGQIDQLNAKIDVLVERQVKTVARRAESTDVNRAADTVCWSVNKVRDAVAKTRREVRGSLAVEATPEAAS